MGMAKKKATDKKKSELKKTSPPVAGKKGNSKSNAKATPPKKRVGSLADFIDGMKSKKKPAKKDDGEKKTGKKGDKPKLKLCDAFLCTDPIPSDTITVPTRSPLFNLFLSERADGGIPLGRVIEVYGDHDQGKTSILTELMIAFQQAGGIVLFHDSDFKFNRERAERRGWMPDRTIYIPDLSIEGVLAQSEKVISKLRSTDGFKECPVMIAWDSAPSTPISGNIPGQPSAGAGGMMEAARILWDRLSRRMIGFLSVNQVTFVATSPQIAHIQFGGKGPKKTTALGGAIKTQATLRIKVWRSGLFKWTENDPPGAAVGIYISLNATKHHFRLLGERQITLGYLFDSGFNKYYDTFNYLMLVGAFFGPELLQDKSNLIVAAGGGRHKLLGVGNSMYYREVGQFLKDNKKVFNMMVRAMESHYLTGLVNEWLVEGLVVEEG